MVPMCAYIFNNLFTLCLEISNLFPTEAAQADYKKALHLDPDIFRKALHSTTNLIQLHPNDYYHYIIRGILHHLSSNESAALSGK
jgi:hypothetical protein